MISPREIVVFRGLTTIIKPAGNTIENCTEAIDVPASARVTAISRDLNQRPIIQLFNFRTWQFDGEAVMQNEGEQHSAEPNPEILIDLLEALLDELLDDRKAKARWFQQPSLIISISS